MDSIVSRLKRLFVKIKKAFGADSAPDILPDGPPPPPPKK